MITVQAHQTGGEVSNPRNFTTGPPMVQSDSLARQSNTSLLCASRSHFLPCRSVHSSLRGLRHWLNSQACTKQRDAARRSVTVSDGEVLTASGSSTTCSTVHLEIHQAFWTGPLEKSSPPCHPIPGPRDTVMFLHQWPQTMGERSAPVQGRKGRARRRPRKGGKVCVTPRRFLSPPLTNGSSHNSLPTRTRSSTYFFFLHISPPSPCCDRRLN